MIMSIIMRDDPVDVDASKKQKIRIVQGIKSLNEYFTTLVGNEDEADEKGLDSQ